MAEHHQFQGLDKGIAGHNLAKMNIGPRPKNGNHIYRLMVMGDHGNTTGRVLFFEQLDLLDCPIWIIAGVDDQQIGSALCDRVHDELVDGGCRSNDPKTRRTQDTGEALPHQGTRPDKYRGKRPMPHDNAP